MSRKGIHQKIMSFYTVFGLRDAVKGCFLLGGRNKLLYDFCAIEIRWRVQNTKWFILEGVSCSRVEIIPQE